MKKLMYVAAFIVAVSFASCGTKGAEGCGAAADSTVVEDTVLVDSIAVDSVEVAVVDSIAE